MSIDASTHGDGVPAANAWVNPVDDLLDRATRRLRIDPELQLEVRQELRTHLDDAIAELRRAGRGEADARAEAIAAMGDPDALAEQLWSSNRRRVRLRAAAAWAARLILPPVAVALIIVLGYGAVASWALSGEFLPSLYPFAPPGHQQIRDRHRAAAIAHVSDQAKELWALRDLPSERRLAAARQLAERAPDDPALYAHYAGYALTRSSYTPTGDDGEGIPIIDEAVLRDMIAVLTEGERREPDNALYPLLLAGVLFNVSAVERHDPSLDIRRPGQKDAEIWWRVEVFDRPRYDAALAALRRAAAKPYYRAYTREVLQRKLDAVPADRLADVWVRVSEEIGTLLPALNQTHAAYRGAALRATEAARAGRRDEADRLLRDLRLLAGSTTADAGFLVELMVALRAEDLAMEADARVRQASGDAAGAAAAWDQLDAGAKAHGTAYRESVKTHDKARAGILFSALGEWTGVSYAVAPMRRAEYAAADQLGVAALSAVVLLIAALCAAWAVVAWLRTPRNAKPVRLFVGWRRIGWIVLLGAVLPLAIYLIYAHLMPLGGRGYGLNETLPRVVLEYAVLTATVMLLLIVLTRRAVRRRAAEIGLPVPGPRDRAPFGRTVTTAAAASAVTSLVAAIVIMLRLVKIPAIPKNEESLVAAVLLAVCWASLAVAGLVVRKRGRGGADEIARRLFYGGTVARSAFAVILLAATVLAIVGLPVRVAESRHVSAAAIAPDTGKPRLFLSELNAAWRDRRDAAVAHRAALLRNFQRNESPTD